MQCTVISVDLSKTVFQIAVSRRPGVVSEHHRLSRTRFVRFFAEHQPATVVMEATGSAHHWARTLRELGHEPALLAPHKVRAYVQGNKTDRADTEGLLEAYRNETIRTTSVPIKSIGQQQLTALHRLRSQWMKTRIARLNGVRGFLRELGLFLPVGARHVVPRTRELIEIADGRCRRRCAACCERSARRSDSSRPESATVNESCGLCRKRSPRSKLYGRFPASACSTPPRCGRSSGM